MTFQNEVHSILSLGEGATPPQQNWSEVLCRMTFQNEAHSISWLRGKHHLNKNWSGVWTSVGWVLKNSERTG